MPWTVRTRYSSLPGSKDKSLVALDVVDGDRVICGVQIRPDHDEAWHLAVAYTIAAAPELKAAARGVDTLYAELHSAMPFVAQKPDALALVTKSVQVARSALIKAGGA